MKKYVFIFIISFAYSFICFSQARDTIVSPIEDEICWGFEYYKGIERLEIIDEFITDTIRGDVGYVFNFNAKNRLLVESIEINVVLIRNSSGVITKKYFDKSKKSHRKQLVYYDSTFNSVVNTIKFWECSNKNREISNVNRRMFVFPFVIIPNKMDGNVGG
jgi:hypothetical protein